MQSAQLSASHLSSQDDLGGLGRYFAIYYRASERQKTGKKKQEERQASGFDGFFDALIATAFTCSRGLNSSRKVHRTKREVDKVHKGQSTDKKEMEKKGRHRTSRQESGQENENKMQKKSNAIR